MESKAFKARSLCARCNCAINAAQAQTAWLLRLPKADSIRKNWEWIRFVSLKLL